MPLQPSARLNCGTISSLTKKPWSIKNRQVPTQCCHARFTKQPKITWAAHNVTEVNWADLLQHITFYFPDTPWPMSDSGSFLPLSLSSSSQVSLCWQWLLKRSPQLMQLRTSTTAREAQAISRPTHNAPLCSKKQLDGKHNSERASGERERELHTSAMTNEVILIQLKFFKLKQKQVGRDFWRNETRGG